MNALKIGIVEDDLIIARSIGEMLLASGYSVAGPARRYSEAIELLETESPDLLLLDIRISGKMDGIDIAETVRRSFGIPFIFLTANTDFQTIARAKAVEPAAFLAKPVTKAQLFAAIEIAVANSSGKQPAQLQQVGTMQPGVFVKDGAAFRRVFFNEILYAESLDNYLRLVMQHGEEVVMRSTLGDFLDEAPGFLQTHRSFAVAADKVSKVHTTEVETGSHTVPMSKTFRPIVMEALGIRKD